MSTAYYAAFHAVCHAVAELFTDPDIQNHVCRCLSHSNLQSLRTNSDYAARDANLERAKQTAKEMISTARLTVEYIEQNQTTKDFQLFMVELLCLKSQAK